MTVTLVAAVGRGGVIGRDGALPWHLPEDLAHFRKVTLGGTLVMGRKTWDSIGRPLPGRRSVVVTRQPGWAADGATTAHSLEAALETADGDGGVFVIGGGQIFRQALPLADRIELTEVDQAPDGDVFFPELDPSTWHVTWREARDGLSFVTYDRRSATGVPVTSA